MPETLGLQAEFYQLVLAAVYHADGLWGTATFDLYARNLPDGHGYLVASGLGPLLDVVEALSFSDDEVAALRREPVFAKVPAAFYEALRRFRFDGEILAVPEGTVVYPSEPILRVTAPLIACTLLETRAIQLLSASTAVSTRAARMVDVAAGRPVLDFGSRRCAGAESALLAARAAYIGGVSATTNALATAVLGVPPMGTMSDTFLAAYGNDRLAYEAFRLHFPGLSNLALPDDDPVLGVERLAPLKSQITTVRIDHEDLGRIAATVRDALDRSGMKSVKILGSGHLDEHRIERLVAARAPINMFAAGRALAASGGESLHMAFRISEILRGPNPTPVTRAGSAPYPGKKQVIRFPDHDLVCLEHEAWSHEVLGGVPLLKPVMRDGKRLGNELPLADIRQLRAKEVAALPKAARRLKSPEGRSVRVSDELAKMAL